MKDSIRRLLVGCLHKVTGSSCYGCESVVLARMVLETDNMVKR